MGPHRVNPEKGSGCGGGDSLTGCCGNNIDKLVRLKREVVKMILIQILKVLMTLGPHVRDIQLGQIQSASLRHGMTTIAKLSGPDHGH